MANAYMDMRKRHQEEYNNFPMVFAFSNEQFNEAMKQLGLEPTDTDKIYSIGAGGYIRKTDSDALHEMGKRHAREMKEAIENDLTGDGFIFDMFDYELANHEFSYTGDASDTLYALDLTVEDVNNDERLLHGLKKACAAQYDE